MTPVTDDNERTRLARTAVQALVSMLVVWVFDKTGILFDVDTVTVVLFPVLMASVTWAVKVVSTRVKARFGSVGSAVELLNGPRREPVYVHPEAM